MASAGSSWRHEVRHHCGNAASNMCRIDVASDLFDLLCMIQMPMPSGATTAKTGTALHIRTQQGPRWVDPLLAGCG